MRFSGYVLLCLLSVTAFASKAAPWVDTNDRYLRSSLKILADGGYLRTPINTYPLMWQPLLGDLAGINTLSMSDSHLFAYLRVMSAADFARQSSINTLSLGASSDAIGNSGFGRQYQQQAAVAISSERLGKNWALGVTKTFADNSHYENGFASNDNWDGSYAAYTLGNWVLSAAQQQLWWGPAYDSSVSFSNNGRPLKALQISRLNSTLPLLAVLQPLGAVNMQLLFAEQPGSALLRHAKVLAARINSKPISQLEVGISVSQLYSVNSAVPANNLQSIFSYTLPSSRVNTVSVDGRYSISQHAATYAELTKSNGEYGWLAGAEYIIANQTVQALLVAEYKKTADQLQDWQSVQHSTAYGQAASRWLAGLELHYRNGSSIYTNLSQASFSENTALVANIPASKRTKLAVGYQTALFSGLVTVDTELSRDALRNNQVEFNPALGVRWERRW
jgi:hypothetical protein